MLRVRTPGRTWGWTGGLRGGLKAALSSASLILGRLLPSVPFEGRAPGHGGVNERVSDSPAPREHCPSTPQALTKEAAGARGQAPRQDRPTSRKPSPSEIRKQYHRLCPRPSPVCQAWSRPPCDQRPHLVPTSHHHPQPPGVPPPGVGLTAMPPTPSFGVTKAGREVSGGSRATAPVSSTQRPGSTLGLRFQLPSWWGASPEPPQGSRSLPGEETEPSLPWRPGAASPPRPCPRTYGSVRPGPPHCVRPLTWRSRIWQLKTYPGPGLEGAMTEGMLFCPEEGTSGQSAKFASMSWPEG